MTRRFDCADPEERATGIERAVTALRRGELVVLPTDTVYGLAADAFDPLAVQQLNRVKGRAASTAVPVMVGSPRTLTGIVTDLSIPAKRLVSDFWPGGLTLVCRQVPSLTWDLGGDGATVAVRMPLHPVAIEVLQGVGPTAVIAANRVGERAPLSCDEAYEQLGDSVSYYLDAGPLPESPPSTIVDVTSGEVVVVVRAGAVPVELLREVVPEIEDRS